MAERSFNFDVIEGVRDHRRFVVSVTSRRPLVVDPIDLWSFAAVSVVLGHMAFELPAQGRSGFSIFYLIVAILPQVMGIASMLATWIVSTFYVHLWARLVSGQAGFNATLHQVIAVLTCSYAIVSLGVLSFALISSALGVPRAAIAGRVARISAASHLIIMLWLIPMRLGVAHALRTGQRIVLALGQLLPLVVIAFLFYRVFAFLGSIPGI